MEGVAVVFVWEPVQDDRPIHSGTRARDGANSHVERPELLGSTKREGVLQASNWSVQQQRRMLVKMLYGEISGRSSLSRQREDDRMACAREQPFALTKSVHVPEL
jgi:hypothetical protein